MLSSGFRHSKFLFVCAAVVEPGQFPDQFLCQLDTFRVNFKATFVNPALSGHHIQIATGCLCEENCAVFIFNFFKTACAALFAERFPFPGTLSHIIHSQRIPNLLHLCQSLALGKALLFSFHPDTPDEKLLVFNSEARIFSSWQGNQGVARRRT